MRKVAAVSGPRSELSQSHFVLVQFGDYRDAFKRFEQGGRENYYAQRYSVDYIGSLVQRFARVSTLCLTIDHAPETLSNGISASGITLYPDGGRPRMGELLRALDSLKPDYLLLQSPLTPVLNWVRNRGIQALPIFFDSFHSSGLKARLNYWQLARALRAADFRWVANHSLAASLDLVRIGTPADRVLPIDWPVLDTPRNRAAKHAPTGPAFRSIFVGRVSVTKGAKDAIDATQALNEKHPDREYHLSLIGHDDGGELERYSRTLSHAARIHFLGLVSHDRIVALMNDHDAVLVPSHHEYPEGLPMTIYEAFCSRSPLIASDHPMFSLRLRSRDNCLQFPAKSVKDLAARIRELSSDAAIYRTLSESCVEAADRHFCPLKYHDVIDRWLSGQPEDDAYLAKFSLAASPATAIG